MTWPLSLSLSLLCRRDPKLACDETIETVDRLIEVLRRPPRLPFAVYVELDCWNWKPVDPKAADASDESVTGEDIEAAPGRHTAAADLVLDSTIITGSIKKGSPKSSGPYSPVDVPPVSFGVAATSAARAEAEAEATAFGHENRQDPPPHEKMRSASHIHCPPPIDGHEVSTTIYEKT